LEFFGIFWNFLEFFGIFWNFLEFFGIFWNFLEFFGIFWKFLEFFGIFWNFLEFFGIFWKFLAEEENGRLFIRMAETELKLLLKSLFYTRWQKLMTETNFENFFSFFLVFVQICPFSTKRT
jgi:hypothetical protein